MHKDNRPLFCASRPLLPPRLLSYDEVRDDQRHADQRHEQFPKMLRHRVSRVRRLAGNHAGQPAAGHTRKSDKQKGWEFHGVCLSVGNVTEFPAASPSIGRWSGRRRVDRDSAIRSAFAGTRARPPPRTIHRRDARWPRGVSSRCFRLCCKLSTPGMFVHCVSQRVFPW